jgi:hypothetical protein
VVGATSGRGRRGCGRGSSSEGWPGVVGLSRIGRLTPPGSTVGGVGVALEVHR